MAQKTNNNLEEKLNEFIGKNVIIIQNGFLRNKYSINIEIKKGKELIKLWKNQKKN